MRQDEDVPAESGGGVEVSIRLANRRFGVRRRRKHLILSVTKLLLWMGWCYGGPIRSGASPPWFNLTLNFTTSLRSNVSTLSVPYLNSTVAAFNTTATTPSIIHEIFITRTIVQTSTCVPPDCSGTQSLHTCTESGRSDIFDQGSYTCTQIPDITTTTATTMISSGKKGPAQDVRLSIFV